MPVQRGRIAVGHLSGGGSRPQADRLQARGTVHRALEQQEERNKRRNEHTNHYMQDCDDELEAIELRGDDVDQSVVDLYGAGAAGTSGSDVATRNVGASGSNGVQSQGSDKLQESRASQDMLSKLAQAQLTINKCYMLIAKQTLRIDELERVLRKFIQ